MNIPRELVDIIAEYVCPPDENMDVLNELTQLHLRWKEDVCDGFDETKTFFEWWTFEQCQESRYLDWLWEQQCIAEERHQWPIWMDSDAFEASELSLV